MSRIAQALAETRARLDDMLGRVRPDRPRRAKPLPRWYQCRQCGRPLAACLKHRKRAS